MASLPQVWHHRIDARIGGPAVHRLCLDEAVSLICNFSLSMTAVKAVPDRHSHAAGMLSKQATKEQPWCCLFVVVLSPVVVVVVVVCLFVCLFVCFVFCFPNFNPFTYSPLCRESLSLPLRLSTWWAKASIARSSTHALSFTKEQNWYLAFTRRKDVN